MRESAVAVGGIALAAICCVAAAVIGGVAFAAVLGWGALAVAAVAASRRVFS